MKSCKQLWWCTDCYCDYQARVARVVRISRQPRYDGTSLLPSTESTCKQKHDRKTCQKKNVFTHTSRHFQFLLSPPLPRVSRDPTSVIATTPQLRQLIPNNLEYVSLMSGAQPKTQRHVPTFRGARMRRRRCRCCRCSCSRCSSCR